MAATVGHSLLNVLNVAETNNTHHYPNINIDNSLLIDLNHLSIVSKISEGSSSTVYEGRYKTMTVAVKMINPNLKSFGSTELIENFAREVMMLSRVKQDNLVSFIGASMEPHLLIVTELMKGGSLKRYLWDMRPACPDLQQSISFALDISRAMEHLHANGIIHRDLKPANLVLTEDHKSLKVADFGLAREESTEEMTSEAGTYRWMAPELFSKVLLECEGKQYYDHKIDIYSFAIVLWELLTNKMPFKGMCSIQAVYAVAKKHRPSVDNLPEYLVRLLDSCWAEDPTIRPEFTVITAYLLDILNAKTNEERSTIQLQLVADSPGTCHLMDENSTQLQVADSPGTCHLMDENSTQLQVADSPGTHHLMDENSTQLQVADSPGTHHLMDENSTQLQAADSPGTHHVMNENSPQLPAADSPRTHHVMNENSPQLPAADSPGTRCLMDETSRTEMVEGRKSGNGLFSFLVGLCKRRDVRNKKKSGNGLFSCVLGFGTRRDVQSRREFTKPFSRCVC